ncbi:MAG: hypothetical protein H0V90_09260 [Blastocatellia bacterium]|nr:hypothetical protein [Blastocatellia bacterium]
MRFRSGSQYDEIHKAIVDGLAPHGKDQRMPRMPTDIVGKLYKEFDTYDITKSINAAVTLGKRSRRIINA